jgi:hypothetical protein
MNEQEKLEIERLNTPGGKRKLNALYKLYAVFVEVVKLHLKDIEDYPEDLEIIYINKFVPKISELVKDLQLGPDGKSPFKLPSHYIPFSALSDAEQLLIKIHKSPDDARRDIVAVRSQLKKLINTELGAVWQEPIPEVEAIITEARGLIDVRRPPHTHDASVLVIKPLFVAASWGGITIRFITDYDVVVQIQTPEFQAQSDFGAMGFRNKNNEKPIFMWSLLLLLSKNDGSLKARGSIKEKDRLKKQKQLLSGKLKEIFGIEEDPFYPYKEEGAYKIKITLEPPKTATELSMLDRELAEFAEARDKNTVYKNQRKTTW